MAIKEYEFFNGAVLNRLIRKGKPIEIDTFPSDGNNTFMINNKLAIYIKYSNKKISPWRFTFTKKHQEELKIIKDMLDYVYLILVCETDGVVCIEYSELKQILDEHYENIEWVSASRLKREKYALRGSDGKMDFKIADNDFPKKIFENLDN